MFGQALVGYFASTVSILEKMALTEEPEVRRSIGVAVHFFAKRRPEEVDEMRRLLSLLSLLVEDRRVFVVKGVGWGIKTIGKYHPELAAEFLEEILETKRVSKLMLRKATSYLSEEMKEKFVELWEHGIRGSLGE